MMKSGESVSGKAPFFSVVIPVHNKGPHIRRALASVLSQTFPDFELLVIDDSSTDDSLEEIKKFSDPRLRVLHRDTPGPGGYAARNLGIREAAGHWIAFLDADDEWFPEHLAKMHVLSEQHGEMFFMGCGWEITDGSRTWPDRFYEGNYGQGYLTLDVKDYLRHFLAGAKPVHTSVACIRRTSPVALDLFPVDKGVQRGGDLHAWLKVICHHGQMAWSDHLGGVYHRDIANMVTKIAPSSPNLMERPIYDGFSQGLDSEGEVLLKKYMNWCLRGSWIGNILRGDRNFQLRPRIYWGAGILNAGGLFGLSFIPGFLIRSFMSLKARIRQRLFVS